METLEEIRITLNHTQDMVTEIMTTLMSGPTRKVSNRTTRSHLIPIASNLDKLNKLINKL